VARVNETFGFGNLEDIQIKELMILLERMYTDLAIAINRKPDFYERKIDGQTSDTFLSQGSININTTTNKVEMLTNHDTATTVTWTKLS